MRKSPKIRFAGFAEDWEQSKLGDVYSFQYGEFNNNPDNGGEYPIYGANGVIGGYSNFNAEDSAVIGHMGAYAGYVVWAEGKHFVTYNGTIAKPSDDSLDSKFGYYVLSQKQIYRICAGSGQPFVSDADLNGIDVEIPKDKSEQEKLGRYFTNLDHLITLHQSKCDMLKKTKKYMLQKMFPKKGELKPEIRFTGFTEDWEQIKLGEVFEEYAEKNHPELPALTIIQGGGTIRRDESDRNISYDKDGLSGYKMVRKNDFILHLRSFEGGLEIATCDGVISPAYHTFHGVGIDARFYYAYFRSHDFIKRKLVPHIYGIRDGKSIDVEGMKSIEIPYPSYAEQKQIGDYLESIDTLITLHQRKCEELKQMKKFMLQNMFV